MRKQLLAQRRQSAEREHESFAEVQRIVASFERFCRLTEQREQPEQGAGGATAAGDAAAREGAGGGV